MLHFSIFHLFFSHQHVQMITGPHEKSGVEKFFGDPFLTKFIYFQKLTGPSNHRSSTIRWFRSENYFEGNSSLDFS